MTSLARRVGHVFIAAALVVCASAAQPASAAPAITLPDCGGTPAVRPAEIVFACADANFSVDALQWTGWGERFAAATGVAHVNDCTPYCAAGHFHTYRMMLTATGRQTCPDGRPAYRTVTYAWIGKAPFASKSAADQTQDFLCRPRR